MQTASTQHFHHLVKVQSQPPTESLVIALRELGYDISVDLVKLEPIADHFRVIKDKYILKMEL